MELKSFEVKVPKGKIVAQESPDPYYKGVNIDFAPDTDNYDYASIPGVRMEVTPEGQLRILVWADKDSEDYSEVIYPTHKF